jgi:glutaryl-CoA dehydrogenase
MAASTKPANTNPDLLGYADLLPDAERRELAEIRQFLEREVKPLATEAWANAEFPFEVFGKYAELGLAGYQHPEFGDGQQRSPLFTGFLNLEMNRIDPSLAVASGVHTGLAMGSIAGGGDQQQRDRWIPDMVAFKKIGAFGLTEPEGGSDVAGGMRTSARREGSQWVLNGAKRWIGNGTFADLVVIWARDEADGAVKGFVVEKGTPGFQATKIENKIALRSVQNADIALDEVRVPETNRRRTSTASATPPRSWPRPAATWPGRRWAWPCAPTSWPASTRSAASSSASPSAASR